MSSRELEEPEAPEEIVEEVKSEEAKEEVKKEKKKKKKKREEEVEEAKPLRKEEEEGELELERFYTIPLKIALRVPRWRRAARAIRFMRSFIARHMKADVVKLDPLVSEYIWSRGAKKPPRRVKVKASKYRVGEETVVWVDLIQGEG